MNRATDGCACIPDRGAAEAFVESMGEACAALRVDLHAYCLLPRHYHMLVRAEPASLRAALRRVEERTGIQVARSPRAVPVAYGRHLTTVSRYIHLNPVDAGLVWGPEQWPYSSFRAYLGDLRAPAWIVTEAVLGRFGTIGSRHRHRAYVYAGLDPGTRDRDGRPRWSSLFGAGSPLEDGAWRVDPVLPVTRPLPRAPSGTLRDPGLPSLANALAGAFQTTPAALRSARFGGASAARARGALVHAARALGCHRLRDVAAFMGYATPATAAAAAERFDAALRLDPELRARVAEALAPFTAFA